MFLCSHNGHGYSLLELLVALSIAAILAIVAYPSMLGDVQQVRLHAEKRKLLAVLSFSRQYAVLHHHSVILCGSEHANDCDGGWSTAWVLSLGGQIQRKWQVSQTGLRIDWRGSFGRNKQLLFDALGYPRGAHGRFILRIEGSPHQLNLIVSPSGIVR